MSSKNKIDNPKFERFFDLKFSFKNSFENINKFIKHLNPIIEKADKEDQEKMVQAIKAAYKNAGVELDKINKDEVLKLTDEQKKIIYKSIQIPERQSPDKDGTLWKSNFVLLISSFEYLISDIISFYYKFYPNSILDKSFEVNIKSIFEYSSIDELVDDVISRKVEGLLYKSFAEQKEFLKKELKINLNEKIINWDLVNESILRRHLIVHNNSKINKRYLSEAHKDFTKDLKELKEGSKVIISKSYFNTVYQELYSAGHILIQECWRKWLSEFEEVANADLVDLTFEGNKMNYFLIAEKIGKFGKELSTINNDFRFRININYCLALKGQNKKNELENEIKKIDISNLSPIFVLAYFSLQDDCKNALTHIKNAKSVDNLEYEDVLTWPLFEGLRKNDDFISRVNKIYRKKLLPT